MSPIYEWDASLIWDGGFSALFRRVLPIRLCMLSVLTSRHHTCCIIHDAQAQHAISCDMKNGGFGRSEIRSELPTQSGSPPTPRSQPTRIICKHTILPSCQWNNTVWMFFSINAKANNLKFEDFLASGKKYPSLRSACWEQTQLVQINVKC